MKEVELIKVVEMYERKVASKDPKFGYYFMEEKVEEKLARIKVRRDAIGDIKMKEEYIKMFLYSGYRYSYGQKVERELTEKKVKDIYKIMLRHPEMSLSALDTLIMYYDDECYKEFDMGKEFDELVKEYGYDDKLTSAYWKLVDKKRQELRDFYKKEADKLEYLKEEYDPKFIKRIQEAIEKAHVKADYAISLIPSKEFIAKSEVWVPIGYSILAGEDIVVRTILGYTDPYAGKDDKPIFLGHCSTGDYIYTSFTKKEYFDEIQRKDRIKITKR